MLFRSVALFAPLLALARPAFAETYKIDTTIVGKAFLTEFDHEAIPDPTHGRGVYVDEKTALAKNLTFASDDTFVMRADDQTVLQPTDPGRDTVRIVSKKQFTTHVIVFDIRHMPAGCGTWPAAWEVAKENWPATGEVDILEGVNDHGPNAFTLHTGPGCTMPGLGRENAMTGTSKSTICDAAVNGNAGCGVQDKDEGSYGPKLNEGGGGFYVMERTNNAISGWFFARAKAPEALSKPGATLDTAALGKPVAFFPNTQCNIQEHFAPHSIVMNLALCGDFAGNTFNSDGCKGNCVDLVNSNPGAFKDAFWDVAGVRVYTPNGAAAPAAAPAARVKRAFGGVAPHGASRMMRRRRALQGMW